MSDKINSLDRKALQKLAKEHNIKANLSNDELKAALEPLMSTTSTKRKATDELESPVSQRSKVQSPEESFPAPEESFPAPSLSDPSKPYLNYKFVVTGSFPVSSDMIERRICALGGAVVKAVNKSTTHVLLGDNGTTEYGGKTGKGSQKYKDAVKKKCTILTYTDLVTSESVATPSSSLLSSSGAPSSSICISLLQTEWNEVLSAISQGVSLGLWGAPTFNPPATPDDIASLERELGYRLGKYTDLLLLANGVTWYGRGPDGTHVAVQFGGTGDGEDDVKHAFNYSGDYGRQHFKRKKQIPMCMIDYDFCVNVFELATGKVMQDDRECGSYHRLANSLRDWLIGCTREILEIVDKAKNRSDPPAAEAKKK